MESAINQHLVCPRTQPRRAADNFEPPYPLWVGRSGEDMRSVVMGYFGVQYHGIEQRPKALQALRDIVSRFALPNGTANFDLTQHRDAQGFDNLIAAAYWRDPDVHARWLTSREVSAWWDSPARLSDGIGYFREIVSPRAEQFETLYGFQERHLVPGVGAVMDGLSGEILEHGYWGAMRDRLPAAQTDPLLASGELTIAHGNPVSGGRVVIEAHDNMALIRSGQDWGDTVGDERELYIGQIEPTLRAGMEFLRDSGQDLGCYSSRFVQSIDLDGNLLEKTYNIGHWRSLDRLEAWAKSHPTHLRIFTTFVRVASGLVKLRLAHEVSVLDGAKQRYEYIGCHARTGMMRDAAAPV